VSVPGIGVDVLEVGRLERALERHPRLRQRIFRPGELAFADRHARPGRQLAARFCAKEAALKALGLGLAGMRDVEILGGGGEPPRLVLHGCAEAAARDAAVTLAVSLSHEREVAVAVVSARACR